MLTKCFGFSRRKKDEAKFSSFVLLLDSKDNVTVRTVHAGGSEELFPYGVPAAKLIEKYPGMCIVRPEVIESPHESLICPEENLLPGQKYYIVPITAIQILKRNYSRKDGNVEESGGGNEDLLAVKVSVGDVEVPNVEEMFCPAKEFYVCKERWSQCLLRRSRAKAGSRSFVPPLPRARSFQAYSWEPSLVSIEELSP